MEGGSISNFLKNGSFGRRLYCFQASGVLWVDLLWAFQDAGGVSE